MQSTTPPTAASGISLRTILGLFKLRIGVVITFTALAGLAVSSGPSLSLGQFIVLTLSVRLQQLLRACPRPKDGADKDPPLRYR